MNDLALGQGTTGGFGFVAEMVPNYPFALFGIELESLNFLKDCFVRPSRRNISPRDETISRFWRRRPETPVSYQLHDEKRRTPPRRRTGDSQMRTLSFVLALAFVLAGPSMAGSSDEGLPGVGTFSYNGSPLTPSVPHIVLIASR